jgi:hypothetical protein
MSDFNKAFPSKYVKASDLNGKAVVVTIDRVKYEKVGQNGDMRWVAYFTKGTKGVVLNKTNCNAVAKIAQSTDTDDWAGKTICLYPCEVEFQGESVLALRVKPANTRPKPIAAPPVVEPEPEPDFPTDVDEDPVPF